MKKIETINLTRKFSLFDDLWTPKIIAELNNQYVKICKLKDDFVWHKHENEDELFMVIKGVLLIDFKHQETVTVNEGEIVVVPKGIEHRPRTDGNLVLNLLFEPKSTLHTGMKQTSMTIDKLNWI